MTTISDLKNGKAYHTAEIVVLDSIKNLSYLLSDFLICDGSVPQITALSDFKRVRAHCYATKKSVYVAQCSKYFGASKDLQLPPHKEFYSTLYEFIIELERFNNIIIEKPTICFSEKPDADILADFSRKCSVIYVFVKKPSRKK